MFVYLFVGIKPEKLYSTSCVGREVNPLYKLTFFVCLFVVIKPEKLYSTSFFWREVNPLGMITHGLRHFYVRETKTAAHTTYLSIYVDVDRGIKNLIA